MTMIGGLFVALFVAFDCYGLPLNALIANGLPFLTMTSLLIVID